MKEFFEFENGFLLIDDDNLYITKTGNWSETKSLELFQNKKKVDYKKLVMVMIALTALAIMGWAVVSEGALKEVLETFSFGAGLTTFLFLARLATNGNQHTYYIPKEKLFKLESDENSVVLHFESADLKPIQEQLSGISHADVQQIKTFLMPATQK